MSLDFPARGPLVSAPPTRLSHSWFIIGYACTAVVSAPSDLCFLVWGWALQEQVPSPAMPHPALGQRLTLLSEEQAQPTGRCAHPLDLAPPRLAPSFSHDSHVSGVQCPALSRPSPAPLLSWLVHLQLLPPRMTPLPTLITWPGLGSPSGGPQPSRHPHWAGPCSSFPGGFWGSLEL